MKRITSLPIVVSFALALSFANATGADEEKGAGTEEESPHNLTQVILRTCKRTAWGLSRFS